MRGSPSTSGDVYSFGILLLEMFTGRRPTDTIFEDGTNLHMFVKNSIPEKTLEIIDPKLLHIEEEDNEIESKISRIEQCFISIFRIGIACSASQPNGRITMKDATKGLISIRERFSFK